MLKTSIQRQVRLGNVARQFSSASLLRTSRAAQIISLRQPVSQPTTLLRSLPQITQSFTRLYSSESVAAQQNREGDFAPVPGAPVSRFSELGKLGVDEGLVRALTDGMGYENMTEVQSMTINPALKGTDMVAQAKTGTGKTLAFLVPLFQRVLADQPELINPTRRQRTSNDIRAIIMSPTRELAEQIGVEARKLAKHTGIIVQTAVGGTRKREALFKMHREGCDVLIATPGRLNDLLSDPQAGVAAPRLQALVLDEADRMLDVGFADELRSITDMLPPPEETQRQTLLFSATIPSSVVHLAKSMVRPNDFEFVQTIKADEVPTHEKVPQNVVTVRGYENSFPAILELVNQVQAQQNAELPFKAIVFFSNTATVQFAQQVFMNTDVRKRGVKLFEIHSKLSQQGRTRSAEQFRRSESAILFSSDVTARGMDFPNVTHVIQVGLPPDREQYIHRVGRTGRAGNSGQGWLILAEPEIQEARFRLPGLPIKPNHDLTTAQHQAENPGPAAAYFQEIRQAYDRVPKSMFDNAYMAMLGQKFGRGLTARDIIGLLNDWCFKGLGWSEQPAISPKVAANRALTGLPGVRIGHNDREEEGFGGYDRGFGGSGGYGRGGGGYGNDRFGGRSGGSYGGRDTNFRGGGGFGSRNNNFGDRGRGGFGGRNNDSRGRGGRSGYGGASF
ncbi:DEAD-domain-containing protein [Xylariaceae sp. FL0255]|nr:DEAD-domain-containing protein [Xylariaceae sp. FL0255]